MRDVYGNYVFRNIDQGLEGGGGAGGTVGGIASSADAAGGSSRDRAAVDIRHAQHAVDTRATDLRGGGIMAAAAAIRMAVPEARRKTFFTGTPEIYFAKAIDNSRVVKVECPGRNREMKQFGTALAVLFLLVFTYAWQHFRAIEYGYQVESSKRELNNLTEMNRALRLEDASLRDPERIDVIARRMGLVPPAPGQVIRMDGGQMDGNATPVMASASPITVLSGQ